MVYYPMVHPSFKKKLFPNHKCLSAFKFEGLLEKSVQLNFLRKDQEYC